jgi:hypothetical protein
MLLPSSQALTIVSRDEKLHLLRTDTELPISAAAISEEFRTLPHISPDIRPNERTENEDPQTTRSDIDIVKPD